MVYDISYYWFSLIAIVVVFVVGIVVSLATKRKSRHIDPDLLFNFQTDVEFFRQKRDLAPTNDVSYI